MSQESSHTSSPPISQLIALVNEQEQADLRQCLAADLTAWMCARALLKQSDHVCDEHDLLNLMRRFELTISMSAPPTFAPRSHRGYSASASVASATHEADALAAVDRAVNAMNKEKVS